MTSPYIEPKRRASLLLVAAVIVAVVAMGTAAACLTKDRITSDPPPPASAVAPSTPAPIDEKLVMTYFFYWYDAATKLHLREADGLRHHLPAEPSPSYRNAEWFKKEFRDMDYAGIDAALAVYWGSGREEWSTEGLRVMSQARSDLVSEGLDAPRIGLFFDTTIVEGRDLTSPEGKDWFYRNFSEFFRIVPREHWAVVAGRPVAFLFTSDWTAAVDQSTFDYVYAEFEREFGVRPYIVREVSWDYPILGWEGGVTTGTRLRDYEHPLETDNNYLWAAAQNGFVDRGGVAVIGPGYDDTLVPGRSGFIRSRDDGRWYRDNFVKAIVAAKPILVIETWNEIHEGSGVSETQEFGRLYLDLTRQIADAFKKAR